MLENLLQEVFFFFFKFVCHICSNLMSCRATMYLTPRFSLNEAAKYMKLSSVLNSRVKTYFPYIPWYFFFIHLINFESALSCQVFVSPVFPLYSLSGTALLLFWSKLPHILEKQNVLCNWCVCHGLHWKWDTQYIIILWFSKTWLMQ